MSKKKNALYLAAVYLRLSREDGDKSESDSIANQRDMILDYLSDKDDIEIVDIMIDDGYSGSNFDRPGFNKMMQAVKNKKVNCIVVKDLSRFSRDYIGSGMYITNLFPKWGVRLIAINDNYDSLNAQTANDELMFSFKSIVNDIYLRDISIKIRSHLEVKRKKGEYIGAFVAYEKQLDTLPKWSLVEKKRGDKVYFYRAFREGKKVITKYIGNDAEEAKKLKQQIEEKRHIQRALKELNDEIKLITKVIGDK